jgi:hypothetical protein
MWMEEESYGVELNSPGMLLIRSVARGCILTRERKWKHMTSWGGHTRIPWASQAVCELPLTSPRLAFSPKLIRRLEFPNLQSLLHKRIHLFRRNLR